MRRRAPVSTRPDTLFPYTALFRSELLFDLFAARGLAVDIALDVAAPQLADQREFVLQFDALGGGLHAQRLGERDDRLDDRGVAVAGDRRAAQDRKSTRLNSSH